MKKSYFLIDTDTTNLVGSYGSRRAALRAVAETVERYGPRSDAATSLALIREDLPAGQGLLARGASLVRLALAGDAPAQRPTRTPSAGLVGERVKQPAASLRSGPAETDRRVLRAAAVAKPGMVAGSAHTRAAKPPATKTRSGVSHKPSGAKGAGGKRPGTAR